MQHPLMQQLELIRGRVRRLWLLFAGSLVLAATLAAIVVWNLGDYFFRWQDHGLRTMGLLAVIGLCGWVVWRFLVPAVRRPLTDLQLAYRLEQRFPQFADQLASTVAFLKQPEADPQAGSAALRRAVITRTAAELENLPWQEVLQPRLANRMALIAGGVMLFALVLTLLSPQGAMLATARLLLPWGGPAWPQIHQLEIDKPATRVARGQPFEIRVRDRNGRLPREVRIEYRTADATGEKRETERLKVGEQQMLVARKEAVTQPFEFRATGGDDQSMAWHAVQIVDPPEIRELQIVVEPPAYTGATAGPSPRSIRTWVDSKINIAAKTSKPIRAASVVQEGVPPIPATVAADGLGFQVNWKAAKSGSYAFRLEDADGFVGGEERRFDLTVLPDEVPTVVVEQPEANLFVTAQAVIPLQVQAHDDLAIQKIVLQATQAASSQDPPAKPAAPWEHILWQGPELPPKLDPQAPLAGAAAGAAAGHREVVTYSWDLKQWKSPLIAGSEINFSVLATDYRPQTGSSPSRRLVILAPDQLIDRLASRQTQILAELARLLKLEEEAQRLIRSIAIPAGATQLSTDDLRALQGSELTQRQVQSGLIEPRDGVRGMIRSVIDELTSNRLDEVETIARLEAMDKRLGELEQHELLAIAGDLTNALKLAQSAGGAGEPPLAQTPLGQHLQQADQGQNVVIAALQKMLGELSKWDDSRRFRHELRELHQRQAALAASSAEKLPELLSRNLKDLSPQQVADLKKSARQQQTLAEELARWTQRAEQTADQVDKSDPAAAQALADAIDALRAESLSGKMRQAAQNLDQNNIGQAASEQQEAADTLQELLDTLGNRPESDLKKLVKKLQEAEADLKKIKAEQADLQRKFAAAAQQPDTPERRRELERLTRRQAEVQAETERLGRKLQRLQAQKPSSSLAKAADSMGGAAEQGGQQQGGGAAEQGEQAQKALEEAEQELAERRQQAEADLAFEELTKLQDELVSVRDRQLRVVEDAKRLAALEAAQKELTAGQQASVQALATTQSALHDETQGLVRQLEGAEVFRLALEGSASSMQHAADRLQAGKVDQPTQTAAETAARRLSQLLAALEPDLPKEDQPQEPGGDGGSGGGGKQDEPPSDGIPAIAQLKLLKLMQEEINSRTQQLEQTYGRERPLTEDERREYLRLGEEQGKLAELIQGLIPPKKTQALEEDPLHVLEDVPAEPVLQKDP